MVGLVQAEEVAQLVTWLALDRVSLETGAFCTVDDGYLARRNSCATVHGTEVFLINIKRVPSIR